MRRISRKLGPAALGVVTVVVACAPKSVVLEHEKAATAAGAGGGANSGDGSGGSENGNGTPSGGDGARSGSNASAAGGNAAAAGDDAQSPGRGGEEASGCGDRTLSDVRNGQDLLPGYDAPRDPRVTDWLSQMSLSEQITQMQGIPEADHDWQDIFRSPDLELATGITVRGYRYRSGTRGVTLDAGQDNRPKDANNFSTAFPVPSIRGASWNLELEWQIGKAIADETLASQNNLLLAPSANIIRHPYWGRAQDCYGEDTYHVGRMASAFVAGAQRHLGACARNFAAYAIEKNRANQDAIMDEQTLREIDTRPFEMAVQDGGVACVMTAYNKVNGVKATVNAHLLRDVLKAPVEQGGFGFRGFVLSEWWAAPGDMGPIATTTALAQAQEMATAGLDVEMPWTLNYGQLGAAVAAGLDPAVVSEAAGRVLEQKARFGTALATDPWGPGEPTSRLEGASIATNQAHLELAERALTESAVLLANGPAGSPVLPIPSGIETIAVIGDDVTFQLISTTPPKSGNIFNFGIHVALGDRATDRVNADPEQSIGPLAGIQAAAADHGIASVLDGVTASEAESADFVVVVVGLTPGDEGEEYAIAAGGDRASLDLPHAQATLVSDVLSLMKPTVIVIESASVVNLPWLDHPNKNQATVWAGYGGMRGGAALAKLLFGAANFAGKLPMAWPGPGEVPPFQDTPSSTALGYFVGYREYDRRAATGDEPDLVFPFGHGLSYTTFEYSNLVVPCEEASSSAVLDVAIDVTNTGAVDGDEVVFLFVAGPSSPMPGARSVKELKSFARVSVRSGQTQTARLPLRVQDLRHWDQGTQSWVVDPGEYSILVGPNGASAGREFLGTFSVAD
jgi:beta-glucosidase